MTKKITTLLDAINSLTPEEAKDEANTVRAYNMLALSELVRYGKDLSAVSNTTMHNLRLLTEATTVRTARHLIAQIVDTRSRATPQRASPRGVRTSSKLSAREHSMSARGFRIR